MTAARRNRKVLGPQPTPHFPHALGISLNLNLYLIQTPWSTRGCWLPSSSHASPITPLTNGDSMEASEAGAVSSPRVQFNTLSEQLWLPYLRWRQACSTSTWPCSRVDNSAARQTRELVPQSQGLVSARPHFARNNNIAWLAIPCTLHRDHSPLPSSTLSSVRLMRG